ncbi:MAG: ATP-binding protein [Candidatus Krumholzibacteria bacterium]|nr:ATP-binding protein [Candidatus Krumholzibacteria bacterium]
MNNFCQSLITFGLLLFSALAYGQELPFTHYTTDSENNPLPSAEVTKICQDRLGFIWIAVISSGLVRYDGHHMDLYTTADGLRDLVLWDVVEDRSGRLWVGSSTGLVVSERPLQNYRVGERVRFTSLVGSTPLLDSSINWGNRIAVDVQDRVWVGTPATGIVRYRFDGAARVIADTIGTDVYEDGRHTPVRSIIVRRDGAVWVGTEPGDLLVFEEGARQPEVVSRARGAPARSVDVLYESPGGSLWGVARGGRLFRVDEADGKSSIVIVSDEIDSNVSSLLVDSQGDLWVATGGAGVMRFDPEDPTRWARYTRQHGILSDVVRGIMEDREGNLWFAQSGGVSKLRFNHSAFENFTAISHTGETPVLPAPAVNSVVPRRGDESAGIWAGTAGGGLVWIGEDGRAQTIDTDSGLLNNWVNGLAFDSEGRLWVGTEAGINCLSFTGTPPPPSRQKQRVVVLGREGELAGYRRTSIYSCSNLDLARDDIEAPIESLWLPGYHSLYCFVGGEWLIFREKSGLPVTSFYAVALDGDGRLLVGTEGHGLYRSTRPAAEFTRLQQEPVPFQLGAGGGTFGMEIITPVFEQVWSRSSGGPTDQIQKLIWRDGVLWVGTPEGLLVLEGESFETTKHLTQADGLGASNVYSMDFSPVTGALWVGTNGGLAEIDPGMRTVKRNVTRQDGLVGNEVWFYESVAAAEDGSVYFGTAKGLAHYWPERDQSNATLPLLHMKSANYSEDRKGNNEITIEYSALSFSSESLVRYKTRLTGYDKTWSIETAEPRIRYTNLPAFLFAKKYVFEVLAANDDGLWTETPLQHAFVAQPAWWFTWWAVLIQLVLLIALVYTLHRYRTKHLARRNKMLEVTVQERTAEIQAKARELREKNHSLEEKNEEIIRTQQQLIVQEKLASLGALTAGIAHEIKNPLNFVNNFAELSTELVHDLREDIDKHKDAIGADTRENIEDILRVLESNVTKINEHGKRADSIVRGMLLHSRGQKGDRQDTDVNGLLDEYVNLAYHGMRAVDAAFNIKIEKDYDSTIEKLEVIPQDLSRVFLNIINNACYATHEKKQKAKNEYSPTLSLRTRNLGDKVEIRIRDNGPGIPREVRDKIFNPFFTTKPTGMGTGLGLSLSYDIIVQEHKGDLKVETEDGQFTEFVISLPKNSR